MMTTVNPLLVLIFVGHHLVLIAPSQQQSDATSAKLPPPSHHRHPDVHYAGRTATRVAFGSCHKNKAVSPGRGIVWDAIGEMRPDAFLWTGDSIYPPEKGTASVEGLRKEYRNMRTNATLGYRQFLDRHRPPLGVHGTWDDHDYGGNDRGREMPDRELRRDAFLEFLDVIPPTPPLQRDGGGGVETLPTAGADLGDGVDLGGEARRRRQGVYHSVAFGDAPNKVLVIFLDTRWHRDRHCIPSIAGMRYSSFAGAIFSCLTRWLSAGLDLPRWLERCRDRQLLGEAQWRWLEEEVERSDARVHVVVSSVQVLTTNPATESWGQFDEERTRLLMLIGRLPGLVILSGDVHYAELLSSNPTAHDDDADQKNVPFLEVTSSGLTHSVETMRLSTLAKANVRAFSAHRLSSSNRGSSSRAIVETAADGYFVGRNFGMLHIDWGDAAAEGQVGTGGGSFTVDVHDHTGKLVLSTGPRPLGNQQRALADDDIGRIPKCVDGHLIPLARGLLLALVVLVVFVGLRHRVSNVPGKTMKVQ